MLTQPTHLELGLPDADAARSFYGGLFGWSVSGAAGPGMVATPSLSIGIHDGDPKAWFEPFFDVEDLDASLTQVGALGGAVQGEIHDSPGFGRWCECTDDQGVGFGLVQRPVAP